MKAYDSVSAAKASVYRCFFNFCPFKQSLQLENQPILKLTPVWMSVALID